MAPISFTINGKAVDVTAAPETPLLWVVREHLQLTGTKYGCGAGMCGACTVLVNGRSARSCLMLAVQADGAEITTIEGIADIDGPYEGGLHPLQEAFREFHGLQCGFCTPGMLTTLIELLRDNPDPSEEEVRIAISGNLCRCTGYQGIVDAALATAKRLREAPATV